MGASPLSVQSKGKDEFKFTNATYLIQYPVNTGNNFVVYYINLDKRVDRKREIETELNRIEITPYQRFSAILQKQGLVGCAKSHIECLKLGLDSGADHILVFEDDCLFTSDKTTVKQVLNTVMKTNYDVFLLGFAVENVDESLLDTNHPMFKKVIKAACCHGYMVTRRYASKLIDNFKAGVKLLEITKNGPKYAIDQYWKPLQNLDLFLCYYKGPLAFQRDGYSDNGYVMTNLMQNQMKQFAKFY